MKYINHRVNTIADLKKVPVTNGAEVDVRYHENDLILHHDPFLHHVNRPTSLRAFVKHWQHAGPLILNLKSEGIEDVCIKLMDEFSIKDWFFLDMSMPFFVQYANKAKNQVIENFSSENLAVRYSEFEPIEYALAFEGKVKWVWVDCFTQLPLDINVVKTLHQSGFKICLVSPELQKHSCSKISEIKNLTSKFSIDAVCTKFPNLWAENDET